MTAIGAEPAFEKIVGNMDELIAVCGEPAPAITSKIIDHVDPHCREFIGRSPFFLLATADAAGRCDVSPRGGPAGFVEVLDEHRIVFANAKGNQLIDSMRNICQTGRAGLLFVIPGMSETLRVNGGACLTRDPEILSRHVVQEGRTPDVAVGVEIEEAFLHCAKAFIRSSLWQPDTWPPLEGLARPAQIWKDHMALPDVSLEAVEDLVEESYRELY
jgi:PPOX class probable FMN-dependent enzyme